jgi:hypothetical protein
MYTKGVWSICNTGKMKASVICYDDFPIGVYFALVLGILLFWYWRGKRGTANGNCGLLRCLGI